MYMAEKDLTVEQAAKYIDHSILRPYLTPFEVIQGCQVARKYNVASVCVKPCDVVLAHEALKETDVAVGTVVGFPHGSSRTSTKIAEALTAIEDGATELDVVLNVGQLRGGLVDEVEDDIKQFVTVVKSKKPKVIVKVIFENAYLTDEEKVAACQLCEIAGADYVKTSTGYAIPIRVGAPTGATVEDLELMKRTVGSKVQIKAAGGINELDTFLQVINTGATRVGVTATTTILEELARRRETQDY